MDMPRCFKRFLFLLPLIIFSFPYLEAQTTEVWQRARIYCSPENREILAATGIALDHPVEANKKWITADISNQEINLARAAGFQVEILIPDLKAWFLEQNQNAGHKQAQTTTLPIPPGFNLGSMGGYITYSELLLELDSMVQDFPNLISTGDSIGTSYEGRTIRAYRISDNPNVDENEPEILYTALHHAREPNALMQMLYYMYYLLNEYGSNPEITCLLDNRELYFVPILNPDGYLYNESTDPMGGGMWRKNRRDNLNGTFGVDLNRNYGANWGYDNVGSSPNSSSDTYRGTAGFSEPETQAIRNFCNSRDFKNALNYHTFGNLLIYPYGYVPLLLTPDSNIFSSHAHELTQFNNYKYGTGVQTVGYVTNGDSDDWMYSEQTTKDKIISMTPEAGDPQFGFWPPQNQILPFCEDNLKSNIIHAWLGAGYVTARYTETSPINTSSAWIPVTLQNLGLDTAFAVSATLELIDANILSVSNTIQIPQMNTLQSVMDSFQVTLANNIPEGTLIQAVVHTRFISCFDKTDTIRFYYGTPQQVYTSDFENGLGTWTSTEWALTTEDFYSSNHSMTDSPNTNYDDNEFSALTLNQVFSLTGYSAPRLEFYARWRIEQGYDYCQLKISANNGPWTALATTRTVIGTSDQVLQPLYDGAKPWGKEVADLTPYIGKNVRFRFEFTSDAFQNDEGFFFDDFNVLAYGGSNKLDPAGTDAAVISLWPNPATGAIQVGWAQTHALEKEGILTLRDLSGKLILNRSVQPNEQVELSEIPAGIYLYTLQLGSGRMGHGKLMFTNHPNNK